MSAPEVRSHRSVQSVLVALEQCGWTGDLRVFDDGVRTAAQAAAGLGCEVGAIANSLVFAASDADGGDPAAVLVLTSGAHRVDTSKVATDLGLRSLSRAAPELVRAATGQAIGGVAPLGHPQRVPTYLDRSLAAYDVVWAAAGHSHAVFSTTYAELLRLTGATEIDVC